MLSARGKSANVYETRTLRRAYRTCTLNNRDAYDDDTHVEFGSRETLESRVPERNSRGTVSTTHSRLDQGRRAPRTALSDDSQPDQSLVSSSSRSTRDSGCFRGRCRRGSFAVSLEIRSANSPVQPLVYRGKYSVARSGTTSRRVGLR